MASNRGERERQTDRQIDKTGVDARARTCEGVKARGIMAPYFLYLRKVKQRSGTDYCCLPSR